MKILIIENTSMGKNKYGFFDKTLLTSFSILPTLQARQIAAITPKKHDTHVLNERYEKINYNEKYDLVLINFSTGTANHAYEIADKFRKNKVTVALSGIHPSGMPEEAKQHADSVLVGRAELSWLKLIEDYEQNNLKPFYYPIKYNKETHLPPTNVKLPGFVITGAVEATRGCPFRCSFCPEGNLMDVNYFERPVDDVIEEIKKIPQKTIMFYDNSLTVNPEYTKKFFKKMIGLKKHFFCNGNVDVLAEDLEFVKLSKKAGCVSWLIGFESVNQETVDAVGKKTNKIEYYKKAVNNIHKNKMAVIGDFIFGFDTDKLSVFDETMKVIKELKIDVADFCVLTPFPGTPLYKQLEKQGRLLTKNWSEYTLKNVVFQPKNMTSEELLEGVRKMYRDFYSIPYTVKRLMRCMKLGLYPFFMVANRNIIATMNSRRLFKK